MKTLLVIPCLRERDRLPAFLPGLLAALQEVPAEVLVVDDGSSETEQAWLKSYIEELRPLWPALLPPLLCPNNSGKGGAVYAGWASAAPTHTQLGFVDADGAIPPTEAARLCRLALASPNDALYAVRTGTAGTRVQRHPARALAGSFFRLLVKILFRFPLPETQCGCKILPAAAWRACAAQLAERRFCFDVELTWHLLRQGTAIQPVPVHWSEIAGGQLRAASVLAMIRSLIRLRRHLGPWQRPAPPFP